jgi:hypothetical protein
VAIDGTKVKANASKHTANGVPRAVVPVRRPSRTRPSPNPKPRRTSPTPTRASCGTVPANPSSRLTTRR